MILFGAHAMDHIPEEDMAAVANAAHAVLQEAINAGVYVLAVGLKDQPASIVSPDGPVTDGSHPDEISGITVLDVATREEAQTGLPRRPPPAAALRRFARSGPTPS